MVLLVEWKFRYGYDVYGECYYEYAGMIVKHFNIAIYRKAFHKQTS